MHLKKFVGAIAITQAAGILGSLFTAPNIASWYNTLNKPPITPPSWVFAPVWTTLYVLMGIFLYLFWIKKGKQKQTIINLFYVQLGLNILWSILFFGLHSPLLGLMGIVVLWTSIVLLIRQSLKQDQKAAYLLLPYILWVSFAGILNLTILAVN